MERLRSTPSRTNGPRGFAGAAGIGRRIGRGEARDRHQAHDPRAESRGPCGRHHADIVFPLVEPRTLPSIEKAREVTMLNQDMRRPRAAPQLDLPLPTWGGQRAGAGRKRRPGREGLVPRTARPRHDPRNPVHVTKRAAGAPDLRAQVPFRAIQTFLGRLSRRETIRVLHFSIQRDHIHLIVEASGGDELARGMQGISSGIARAVNRAVGRRGPLWRDRYHRHDLTTPRMVRNCIVYVLMNFRKHAPEDAIASLHELDSRSSAAWFDGWDPRAGPLVAAVRRRGGAVATPSPVSAPETSLAALGWRRLGLVGAHERPAAGR
jgi:putative transposase